MKYTYFPCIIVYLPSELTLVCKNLLLNGRIILSHPRTTWLPLQLFTAGVLLNINSEFSGIEGVLNESDFIDYGIDGDEELPVDEDDYQVNVPPVEMDLTDEERNYIEVNCNPLEGDGKERFMECVQLLTQIECNEN